MTGVVDTPVHSLKKPAPSRKGKLHDMLLLMCETRSVMTYTL